MELKQLIYYNQICRSMNLTTAAKELFISQPALSISIRKLEKELGLRLFHRTGKKLSLTEPGRQILEQTREVLRQTDQLTLLAAELRADQAKTLRIGFSPNIGAFLWNTIKVMERRHPKTDFISYDIMSSAIKNKILQEEIDLGYVMIKPEDYQAFEVKALTKQRIGILLAANHPLAQSETIDISDLKDLEFVFYNPGSSGLDEVIGSLFSQRGYQLKCRAVNEYFSVLDMVAKGLAVSATINLPSSLMSNQNLVVRRLKDDLFINTGFIQLADAPPKDIVPEFIREAGKILQAQSDSAPAKPV